MSGTDRTPRADNSLAEAADFQTAEARPTLRRRKNVPPLPIPASNFQKVQLGVPDTSLTREATGLLHEFSTPLLFNYPHRVFFWSDELSIGRQAGEPFDVEQSFVWVAFHWPAEELSSADDRFEVDSANAARHFLQRLNVSPARIQTAWDAISLHTTAGIAANHSK